MIQYSAGDYVVLNFEYKIGDYVILNFGDKLTGRVAGIYSAIDYEITFCDDDYYMVHPNEIERLANDEEVFNFLMEC